MTLNNYSTTVETTWLFPVEPAVHVENPHRFSGNRTWRLITQVTVRFYITTDANGVEDGGHWASEAKGYPATKAGEKRGYDFQPCYGPEADALRAAAKSMLRANGETIADGAW